MRPLRSFVRCSTNSSLSLGFREYPSPSFADRPERDRICEPSLTMKLTQRRCFTSMSSKTNCLVQFAWSVQQMDRMAPRNFFCARFVSSCA